MQPNPIPHSPATLVRHAIGRPDEPRHFMVIERLRGTATARVGGTVLARSDRALLVKEVGASVYDPVVYFPPGDVRGELLSPVERTTQCPLKGTASYYDVGGEHGVVEAAWSYQDIHTFDERLTELECCVAFDTTKPTVQVIVDSAHEVRTGR